LAQDEWLAVELGYRVLQLHGHRGSVDRQLQVEALVAVGGQSALKPDVRAWVLTLSLPGEGVLKVGLGVKEWRDAASAATTRSTRSAAKAASELTASASPRAAA
jgi:hypothetical protein